MTVRTSTGTKYAVRNSTGLITCHTASQTRKQLKSTYRARYRAQIWKWFELRGLVNIADGTGLCVACGNSGTMALNENGKAMPHTLTIGHDIPDCDNGALCPCNALPLHEFCNRELGDVILTDEIIPYSDPRNMWEFDLPTIKRVRDIPTLRLVDGPSSDPDRSRWMHQDARMRF